MVVGEVMVEGRGWSTQRRTVVFLVKINLLHQPSERIKGWD